MGMMTEGNFVCLNCVKVKLIQELQTISASNATKDLCENKTMQQLMQEYYNEDNNGAALMQALFSVW
ncbi:unnamed protein product [Vitrella brassicaformis CCMP3155]|uniref:Uncharacterized protein n=1 Tax=Vitrella brassicaformis (strain CCMP3155) TaxID=1169540 RepID=A0A0G4EE89_VITBC|nr:unnamed protein product [Vitrella brassicaformis CCMP3155]|eukprot:CEL93659.1 unnamed protein product [Vitrella brassicaformis CCMP3155]